MQGYSSTLAAKLPMVGLTSRLLVSTYLIGSSALNSSTASNIKVKVVEESIIAVEEFFIAGKE